MKLKLLFFLGILVSISGRTQVLQLTITQPLNDTSICRGDEINLQASAIIPFLLTDFNNGSMGVGWSSTAANPVFTNPCGPGPNGLHLWVGTTPSNSRTLVTNPYNLNSSNACYIEFYMRYGRVQSSGNCEDPDNVAEGVHLQYSTNGGSTWTDFPGSGIKPIGNTSVNPPFTTTTPGTGGYWPPVNGAGNQMNNTLYYWNQYRCPIPPAAVSSNTQFRWAQLATSSTGFDAWGIDEVLIGCDASGLLWSTGNTTTTDTVYPNNTTTYWVQANGLNGIILRDSITVTVQKPQINLPDTLFVCAQDSVQLDAGADGNQYLWSNGHNQRMLEVDSTGTYWVTVTDALGCTNSDSCYISFNDIVTKKQLTGCDSVVNPVSPSSTLFSSTVVYDTLPSYLGCDSIVEYNITISSSASLQRLYDTICYNQTYSFGPIPALTATGRYYDTLQNNFGCDSLIELNLQVLGEKKLTDTVFICFEDSFAISPGQYTNVPGNYTRSFSTLPFGCDSTYNVTLVKRAIIRDTIYANICGNESYTLPYGTSTNVPGFYTHIFTSIHGCDSAIYVDLKVLKTDSVFIDTAICFGQDITIGNLYTFNTSGNYKRTLTSIKGCDSLVHLNLIVKDTQLIKEEIIFCGEEYVLLPNGDTTRTQGVYTSVFTNALGCDSTIITRTIYFEKPDVSLSYFPQGCNNGVLIQSSISNETPPLNYIWSDGSNQTSTLVHQTDQKYSLTILDGNGCTTVTTIYIPKVDSILINPLFEDTVLVEDNPVSISAYSNGHVKSWQWLIEDDTVNYNRNFNHYFSDTGWYKVYCKIETYDNCIIDSSFYIYVDPAFPLFMPTAFTPNNDGINEVFGPVFYKNAQINFSLFIYNRWGTLVSTLYNKNWDGKMEGQLAAPDQYVYMLQYTNKRGKQFTKKGSFTLIR